MTESIVLREVETCLSHYGFFVVPRDARPARTKAESVWSLIDTSRHVGVVWRCNTGAGKFGNRFVRFGIAGLPDFQGWLFRAGERISIEVKTEKGTITPDQAAHLDLSMRTGCYAGIVRSYDGCAEFLESIAIRRKK